MKVFVIAAVALTASLQLSAQTDDARTARAETLRSLKENARPAHGIVPQFSGSCQTIPMTLPSTVTGVLNAFSCTDPILSVYENVYAIQGIAGQTLQLDYSSNTYEVFLWLQTNGSGFGTSNHVSSIISSGTSRETMEFTFPVTKTYYIEAEALWSSGGPYAASGPYTLTAKLKAGTASCSPSDTQLCLNGGRFAVSVAWKDFDNHTGTGHTVPMTYDTGGFWFFGSQNYELVIKVLDGTPVNNRFWVFYGALSTVEYTITVKDTITNKTKTYVNKSGTLGSIADTDAFAP